MQRNWTTTDERISAVEVGPGSEANQGADLSRKEVDEKRSCWDSSSYFRWTQDDANYDSCDRRYPLDESYKINVNVSVSVNASVLLSMSMPI